MFQEADLVLDTWAWKLECKNLKDTFPFHCTQAACRLNLKNKWS